MTLFFILFINIDRAKYGSRFFPLFHAILVKIGLKGIFQILCNLTFIYKYLIIIIIIIIIKLFIFIYIYLFFLVSILSCLLIHPLCSLLISLGGFSVTFISWLYNILMYYLIVKPRARIPIHDTFLAKRIQGKNIKIFNIIYYYYLLIIYYLLLIINY